MIRIFKNVQVTNISNPFSFISRSNVAGTHGEGVVREVITSRADFCWNGSNPRNVSETVGGRLIFSSSSPSNNILPSVAQRRAAFVLGGLTSLSILFCNRLPSNVFELNWLLHINNGAPQCLTRESLMLFAPDLLVALDDFDRGNDANILPIVESYCYSGTVSAVRFDVPLTTVKSEPSTL